jgi:hypothetical protein
MEVHRPLQSIPDNELLSRLAQILGQSRGSESDLVAHIAEVDGRRLYAREACSSMFAYCTQVLHLSEAEAFLRITAARGSGQYPVLLEMLRDGRLHLSGIGKLVPHLTPGNAGFLLERATYKSKREIEELVAEVAPRPDVASVIRKLPERRENTRILLSEPEHEVVKLRPDGVRASPTPTPAAVIEALAPARYKVLFTAGAELQSKLERLQALMPGQDLAAIIEVAVAEKLERLEAKRFAKTTAPRRQGAMAATTSRHIPAGVKRAVYARDGNRCRFVDKTGRRCTERQRLEFHHRHPFALGGDHDLGNIRLMCRTHNAYVAELDYGTKATARYRRAKP